MQLQLLSCADLFALVPVMAGARNDRGQVQRNGVQQDPLFPIQLRTGDVVLVLARWAHVCGTSV